MLTWMGWTNYESTHEYGDIEALYMNGDSGRAYGLYQFDYRWGLVPFMESCIEYSSAYSAFQTYVDMGAGATALIGNAGLVALFRQFAENNTSEFQMLQDNKFIEDYLEPVLSMASSQGVMNLSDPFIRGTLGSMAIREGWQGALTVAAVQAMASQTEVDLELKSAYQVFDNYFHARGDDRWWKERSGWLYGGQYGRVLNDYPNTAVYDIGETPEPVSSSSNLLKWMMYYGLEGNIWQ